MKKRTECNRKKKTTNNELRPEDNADGASREKNKLSGKFQWIIISYPETARGNSRHATYELSVCFSLESSSAESAKTEKPEIFGADTAFRLTKASQYCPETMFLHYHTKHMRGLLNVANAIARFNINE